jgi:hypothetical protein
MPEFLSTPLFGGAIVCDLPEHFADVSKLRQVPDNQEVWIDRDGFTSIIFDITERVGPSGQGPKIDGRALTTHLEELVGSDKDSLKIWNTAETEFSRLEYEYTRPPCASTLVQKLTCFSTNFNRQRFPAYTLISTQTPQAGQSKERSSAPDFTALIMTLLRLEKYNTDILITINVPHIKGEYDEEEVDLELGKQGQLIGDAVEFSARIWESFKIKDWGLFGES